MRSASSNFVKAPFVFGFGRDGFGENRKIFTFISANVHAGQMLDRTQCSRDQNRIVLVNILEGRVVDEVSARCPAPWTRGGTARFEVFRETTRQNSRGESGAGLLLPPEITEVNTASTVLPLPKNSQRPAAAHPCKRGSARRRHEEQAEKPSVELSKARRTGSADSPRDRREATKRYSARKHRAEDRG